MSARRAARVMNDAQPGFFRVRMVRGGPWVPAVIFLPCPWICPADNVSPDEWCLPLDRSRRLMAQVAGRPVWPEDVWNYAEAVSIDEHDYLRAVWDWAQTVPDAPEATPRKAVDLRTVAINF